MVSTENNSKKGVTVSGKVLLSTIDTMDFFGKIAHEVLDEYGISELELEKQYPFEIRSAMHKAALDRFGEKSILAFGFNHGEIMINSVVPNLIEKFGGFSEKLCNSADEDGFQTLNEIMELCITDFNRNISGATQGVEGIRYGFFGEINGVDGVFNLKAVMAADLHQEAFIRGVVLFVLTKFLHKYFDFTLEPIKEKNLTGYGYSEFNMIVKFRKHVKSISSVELLWKKKLEVRDELMKQVLKKSDNQNETLKRLSGQLGKYVPPQIHEAFIQGKYDTGIATRRKKLTIFFSDIVNFTSTSEGLQPEDLTKYLNEYFSEMTTIAIDCGATIDKYIGDAMMVFFGDPESSGEKEDARACMEMGLRMQERLVELQEKWSNEGFADPFRVRMGINTGYCNVGNFGSDQRLTYTIIGGEVNVAQRLEAGADANGILMSYETYAHVQDMIEVEERDAIKMKGISREIKVFSVSERKTISESIKLDVKKESTKRELSEIEKIKKDILIMKHNMEDLNENIKRILKRL